MVTDHGKPVMALMPIANADLETVALSTAPRFIALIERSRARQKPGQGVPLEEIKCKYGIRTKHVRRRSRRARKRRRSGAVG